MSYSNGGMGASASLLTTSIGAPAAPAAAAGSTAGYPPAERTAIVNALRAAAIVLNGQAGTRTTAMQIATRDVALLRNYALLIEALRPGTNGLVPSGPIRTLLTAMLAKRPTLGPKIDAQLAFRRVPLLAARLTAMATPPAPVMNLRVPVLLPTAPRTAAPSTTTAEVPCNDGYFRDAAGLCIAQQVAAATTASPPAAQYVAPVSVQPQAPDPSRYAEPAADPTADMAELFGGGGEAVDAPAQTATDTVVATPAGLMAKLDAAGPLGLSWKYWGVGVIAAVAGGGYLATRKKSVTPNRRRRHSRRAS